jgi:hypothetical protein
MFLGGQAAAAPFVMCSKIFTFLYFIYFLIVLPFVDKFEEKMTCTQQGTQKFAILAISCELFAEAKEEIEKGLTNFTSPAGSSLDAPLTPPSDEHIDGRLSALLKALEKLLKNI